MSITRSPYVKDKIKIEIEFTNTEEAINFLKKYEEEIKKEEK